MFRRMKKKVEPVNLEGKYAACDSFYAGPKSPYHVRVLTTNGLQPPGKSDTGSLCGVRKGADRMIVDVNEILKPSTKHRRYCTGCVEVVKAEQLRSLG